MNLLKRQDSGSQQGSITFVLPDMWKYSRGSPLVGYELFARSGFRHRTALSPSSKVNGSLD